MKSVVFLVSHLAAYSIREDGIVFKDVGGQLSVQPLNEDEHGYLQCRLTVSKGVKKSYKAHILVAGHFIDNPGELPDVNHIDGDKANCAKANLEWVTKRGNNVHAYRSGLRPSSSRFYGVSRYHQRAGNGKDKWKAGLSFEGRWKALGHHDAEEDAARAVNEFITTHNLGIPLNAV